MFIYNLQEMAKSLKSEYDSFTSRIEHTGIKGTIREDKLKEYLKKLLPQKYNITSGCIVDANEKQSKQQDFIIYDNFNSPSFIASEKEQVVPIESVYATVEVKSTLTIDELKKSLKNIESVQMLERVKPMFNPLVISSIKAPICMVFAYTSDTSLENIVKHVDEINKEILVKNRVSIICVLDKGIIFGVDKYGFINIELNPSDRTIYVTHNDVLENNLYLFYLLMISGLNNINLPPVNLMGYAEKVKKADYSHTLSADREIPEDAYMDTNGIHINMSLARKYATKGIPLFKNFSSGNMKQDELKEYIVTFIYGFLLDPMMTGKENLSRNDIDFLGMNITIEEMEILKKSFYEKKYIEESNEIMTKIFKHYKENINKDSCKE
ncbi:MAG: DUF6602 domain-containing protein [Candidatus Scatovivens sp.]